MRGTPTDDGVADYSAVARRLISEIRKQRATSQGKAASSGPVLPDGRRRAYVLDSLRHPAEVHLLRHVYQDAFFLIGVVCEEERRVLRLRNKYQDAGDAVLREFMRRDANAKEKHGQQVAKAFHLADFFIDNTEDRQSTKANLILHGLLPRSSSG